MTDPLETDRAPPPPRPRRSWTGLMLRLTVAAALVAVGSMIVFAKKKPEVLPPVREKIAAVRVIVVDDRPASTVLELPARVEPSFDGRLAAEKGGRVEELAVDRGARVRKGQPLAAVDARAWEARLRQAEVEQREAARDLARWEELRKTGAVAGRDYDAVRARSDRADAALDEIRIQTAQCRVFAPVDGLVADRMAEVGEYIMEGAPLFRLIDIDTVKLLVDVPEQDLASVTVGGALPFSVDSLPDLAFTGRVSFVAPTAGEADNTFRVEAQCGNPGHRIKGGMLARVRLARPAGPGVRAIPLSAVVPRRGDYLVFVVVDDRAAARTVTLETMSGDRAFVSSGVEPGDRLVVEGHRTLSEGLRVKVVE